MEEENKYNEYFITGNTLIPLEISTNNTKHNTTHTCDHSNFTTVDFTEYKESDYINCNGNHHVISECVVMKRILQLLRYYGYQRALKEKSTIPIYEYLSSLKHYDIHTLMEDWYQLKMSHFKNENCTDWILS
eukprot:154033_1